MTTSFNAQYNYSEETMSLMEIFQRLQNDFKVYEAMDRIQASTGQRPKYLTMHPETFVKYFGEYNPLVILTLRIVKDLRCPTDRLHISVEPFKIEDLENMP